MRLCLFRADHAGLDQASHIGVVASYPRNLAIADEVESRIADVRVVELVTFRTPDDRGCSASGSHATQFGVRKAVLADLLMSGLQSLNQRSLRIVTSKL